MRYGLVTDIHSHAALLSEALKQFRDQGVEQVVSIGDAYDAFRPRDETEDVCLQLEQCGAVGVWGNHDFGLSHNISDSIRQRYTPRMLDATARMQPRLLLGDCHFSHKEASIDPYDLAQLWFDEESPLDLIRRAGLAFAQNAARWQFVGHYHRWWAGSPGGAADWNGDRVLRLDPDQRWFVVVAAVCDGFCAVFDSNQAELIPLQITR
jgi:hypothetical protein